MPHKKYAPQHSWKYPVTATAPFFASFVALKYLVFDNVYPTTGSFYNADNWIRAGIISLLLSPFSVIAGGKLMSKLYGPFKHDSKKRKELSDRVR